MSSLSIVSLFASVAALLATPVAADTVVPLGHFTQVALHGGGEITLKHGATQRVTLVKGSTAHTSFVVRANGQLEINACDYSCPHSYDLQIEIVSPDIRGAAIDGGGEIRTDGTFPAQSGFEAAINGGGEIDVRAIRAHNAAASINGGGKILITAIAALEAAVSGGGEIVYRGNPAITQAIQGGGSVQRQTE
jgi:hypothetical protein